MNGREILKDKKRIVIKIGSSSLTHKETGNLNLNKLEKLVRVLCDLRNQGKDVVLVSSGAIAVGRKILGLKEKPVEISKKQACASIGQASLMTVYQKLFSEYHQVTSQVLITKNVMINDLSRKNARNTFEVHFYLVAILFLMFDLEISFLYPWAVSLSALSMIGYFAMVIFFILLTLGFIYEYKKGALEWE